jgi:hypothetical protein
MRFKQKLTGLAVVTTAMALFSMPGVAAVQTWNFDSTASFTGGNTNGNSLSLTNPDGSGGTIGLTITGWSDTGDVGGDDNVETARLIWAATNSIGVRNQDEDTTSPHHSVDSVRSGGDSDGDFDMLLLEFTTAVNLTGIDLSWAIGGNAADTADISLLAHVGGSDTLLGNTWGEVLGASGTAYDSAGNYSNVGLSYFTVNPGSITSNKWLLGVYNPAFGAGGDKYDDGIKLASLTTSTTDTPPDRDVPVPGTLVLLLAGLAALRARRSLNTAHL